MAKAYSYIRFSTPEQAKGTSLERQVKKAEAYAAKNGLDLDDALKFRDLGVSAYKKANLGKEGQLAAFLAAVDSGLVAPGSHLLVESLDRLTRAGIDEALELFLSILRRKIIIHTLIDNLVYRQEDLAGGQALQQLVISLCIFSRANEESKTKGERIRSAWTKKRLEANAKKMTRLGPGWTRYDEGAGKFEAVPERVAVVRRIIAWVYSGLGSAVICKRLNAEKVTTFLERQREVGWYPSYIKKILRSRALIGELQPHREDADGKRVPEGPPLTDYFPAVITSEEFAALQAVLNGRSQGFGGRRGVSFSNMFTGLLKCGYCGSTLSYVSKGYDKQDKAKPWRYLACSKAKRGAGCCYVTWPYHQFEQGFLKNARTIEFRAAIGAKSVGNGIQNQRSQLTRLRSVVSDIDLQLERLVGAIASGSAQPQAIVDRIAQQEAEKAQMLERIKLAEAALEADELRDSARDPVLDRLEALQEDLGSAHGDELYDLRAEINESLRHQLTEIRVFAGGLILKPDEIETMRMDPGMKSRYKAEDIEKEIERSTLPLSKKGRFFQIQTSKGTVQVVHPDQPIPDLDDAIKAISEKARAGQLAVLPGV